MPSTTPSPTPVDARGIGATTALPVAAGLTVYGCEHDEAELFRALSPQYGVDVTLVSDPVTESAGMPAPTTRCVSVGHKADLTRPMLRALSAAGVAHVSTRSIGLDHIDLGAAAELGITVENTVYAPDGVADFTLMLMLMALRGAKRLVGAASRGDFRLAQGRDRDLCDLTVGVVGVGRIGAAVIERLRGFGCRVVAHDPGREIPHGVSLRDLLRASDIVTLHLPLTPGSRHLLDRDAFAAMRPGAILVNTARGGLVDTAAMIHALETGRLGGVAVDVLEEERGHFYVDRTGAAHPFLTRLEALPHAIVTPHTAYYTERALRDTVEQTLTRCAAFERNRIDE